MLNLETYQAAIGGKPLDLTYMEYELLKFLASHPGKVFTRETLLSRVWGYEYYGGARTVDVHIRRLRAKLGEEHANLIQTVRWILLLNSLREGGDVSDTWHQTACILCSVNCGIEVRLGDDGRTFERIRGDKAHPTRAGYTCEKALRLDHYQNGRHRLTTPLRRRPTAPSRRSTGTPPSPRWPPGSPTCASRTAASDPLLRRRRQGNHLGGAYGGRPGRRSASATRRTPSPRRRPASSGSTASSSAAPVPHDGRLRGRRGAVFVGKNPWQSHGFPRAAPS